MNERAHERIKSSKDYVQLGRTLSPGCAWWSWIRKQRIGLTLAKYLLSVE